MSLGGVADGDDDGDYNHTTDFGMVISVWEYTILPGGYIVGEWLNEWVS